MDLAGAPSTVPEHEADDPDRFLNRELSWLDFNARVLESAADPRVPLLERAKFCAIFSQNLDEFFQVRVAGLADQLIAKLGRTSPDGKSPGDQLKAIAARVGDIVIAGKVDRLLVTATEVQVIDFKTGNRVPDGPDKVERYHLRQMAAYAAALAKIT